jgi:hypothetical protein
MKEIEQRIIEQSGILSAEELFIKHFDKFRHGLYKASLDSYLQSGKVSGSLLIAIKDHYEDMLDMIKQYHSQFEGKELPEDELRKESGNEVTDETKEDYLKILSRPTLTDFPSGSKEPVQQSNVTDEEITNAFCDTRIEDIKMHLDYRDRDYFQAGFDFARSRLHPTKDSTKSSTNLSTNLTDGRTMSACRFAKRTTRDILAEIKQWEKDGRPSDWKDNSR